MAKKAEYFIAQRTSHRNKWGAKRSAKRDAEGSAKRSAERDAEGSAEGGMMRTVATIAIALSVAVMILSIAIIVGFKSEIHSRLTALSGDIIVTSTSGVNPTLMHSIGRSEQIEQISKHVAENNRSGIRFIAPYAARTAIVRTPDGVEGVVLKGVDSSFIREPFERGLIDGEIPSFAGERGERGDRNTIVSKYLATNLNLEVGSRLELIVTNEEGDMRRDLYRVGAISTTGAGEAEKLLIITDIRNVQRINGWQSDQISGYEIGITNRNQGIDIAKEINREILFSTDPALERSAAFSTETLYPAIFDWLAALDINTVVIITIMTIVAIFNIITALLILVLERVQMVGILKTLGMSNFALRRLFLLRALDITLRGLAWGNGVGIALALIQKHYKIVRLDEVGYILDRVPIELDAWWLIALNVGVIIAILLCVIIPTRIVSRIEPCEAVKFQ